MEGPVPCFDIAVCATLAIAVIYAQTALNGRTACRSLARRPSRLVQFRGVRLLAREGKRRLSERRLGKLMARLLQRGIHGRAFTAVFVACQACVRDFFHRATPIESTVYSAAAKS
jgi:hypothetical protein